MTNGDIDRRQLLVGAGAAAVCVGCSVLAEDVAEQVNDNATKGGVSFVGGLGQPINIGLPTDVIARIREEQGFWYRPDGRMWLVEFPADALERARQIYSAPELAGMELGIVALFQKCTHLGCRVPSCATSQWFECPCHGSKYNRVGEQRGGPAPRGLDRFAIEVNDLGEIIVKPGQIVSGPPIGTNTTLQEAEGPNCIGESSTG